MELLSGIAIVCGPESIVHLLEKVALSIDTQQSVVDEPNRQSTSSSQSMDRVKSIEMDVEHAATALVELGQSLDLLESGRLGSAATASVGQVSANERRVAIASIQVLQLTALLKLLGSASNSGRVKVADVGSLIEDLWVMEVPDYGKLLSWVLAQLRVFIVQQVC